MENVLIIIFIIIVIIIVVDIKKIIGHSREANPTENYTFTFT